MSKEQLSFMQKIGELILQGYSVGFTPCPTGIRLILQKDKKRHALEYSAEYPDKVTVSALDHLKEILKDK